MCVYVCMYIYIYIYMYVYIYIYIYIHIRLNESSYASTAVCPISRLRLSVLRLINVTFCILHVTFQLIVYMLLNY